MSEEMVRVEFYGANGYCTICHQPLEGRGCPYCGWEDKNPPQSGYVKMEDSREKVDKRKKGKNKYWYYITVYTCVLCWHEDEYRERRYDLKPTDWREEFHETACGSHF